MPNHNKVTLMGNITRDIETKDTQSGLKIAKIGLAINRTWYNKQTDERQEETTFVDCTAFGKQAEVMAQYLSKGRPVFIEGRLKFDQWEDKEGNKRSKLGVIVEGFQFIDSKQDQSPASPSGSEYAKPATAKAEQVEVVPSDEIPF